MKFEYSDDISPPGLIVTIQVSGLGIPSRKETKAIIDTGADISVIPSALVDELGLHPRGYRHYRLIGEKKRRVAPTYYVSLKIQGRARVLNIAVIASNEEYALLGRDFLNRFVLHADGPKKVFELDI